MFYKSSYRLASTMSLLFLLLISGAQTATIEVCKSIDEGCKYISIQEAINNAERGDTIVVHSGTYRESVNVGNPLTIRGVDTEDGIPVVDAGGNGNAITLTADGIKLVGFKVTGSGRGWMNAGILVESDENVITENVLDGNLYGIYLNASNENFVTANDICGNAAGIGIASCHYNTITDNMIKDNEEGIEIRDSYNNTISQNSISYNEYGICHDIYSILRNEMDDNFDMNTNNYIKCRIDELIPIGWPVTRPPWELISQEENGTNGSDMEVVVWKRNSSS